jgi:hypothetical protein
MSKKHVISSSTCLICTENISKGKVLHKSRRLTHKLCDDCFQQYIDIESTNILIKLKSNIREPRTYNIQCCGSYHGQHRNHCSACINISNLIVENNHQDLHNKLSCILEIKNNPHYLLCPVCPVSQSSIYLSDYDSVTCNSCAHNWCKKCMTTPYHVGLTCIEHQAKENKTETGKLIWEKKMKGILKFCPTCNTPTEKETDINGNFTGCNKMSCAVCLTRWCWLCNEKNINYDHFTTSINCANRLWEGVEIID